MKIRKSGLGGYFAVLNMGTHLRFEKCAECGQYIAPHIPWLIKNSRRELLIELHENNISIKNYGIQGNNELICGECLEKQQEKCDTYIDLDFSIGTPKG